VNSNRPAQRTTTNFSFLTVEGDTTQIQLSLGSDVDPAEGLDENETYEVDTPQVAVHAGCGRESTGWRWNEAGNTTD